MIYQIVQEMTEKENTDIPRIISLFQNFNPHSVTAEMLRQGQLGSAAGNQSLVFFFLDLWSEMTSSLLPLRRKFLLSYEGTIPGSSDYSHLILSTLSKVGQDQTDDLVSVNATCATSTSTSTSGLCGTETSRRRVLKDSTFAVIFVEENPVRAEVNQRLFESLQVTL